MFCSTHSGAAKHHTAECFVRFAKCTSLYVENMYATETYSVSYGPSKFWGHRVEHGDLNFDDEIEAMSSRQA